MAVTAYWYALAFVNAFNEALDANGSTVKTALTTNTYSPNQDTNNDFADITNEITGTGYSAGGAAIGTPAVTNTLNVVKFDGADVSWTTATFTARRAVNYEDSAGTAGADPLISWVDFGADETVTAGTFTIAWNASGIGTISVTNAAGFP